jgi:hypothetical protein
MSSEDLCVVCGQKPANYDDYTCSDVCFGLWQAAFGHMNVLPLRGTGLPQLLTQYAFLVARMDGRLARLEAEVRGMKEEANG